MLRHDFLILSIALRYDVVWPPRQRRPCKKIFTTVEPHRAYERPELMGGGKQPLTFGVVSPFLRVEAESFEPGVALEIVTFASSQTTSAAQTSAGELWGVVPLKMLLPFCMKYHLLALTKLHDMTVPGSKRTVDKLIELLISHVCDGCPEVHTLFRIKASAVKPHITKQDWSEARKLENKKRLTEGTLNSRSIERSMLKHVFPPPPPSALLQDTICSDYCKAFDPDVWEEGACMVCAELKPHSQLSRIDQCPTLNLALLKRDGVTRVQRVQDTDDICEISSPIVLPNVDKVCTKCEADLRSSRVPKYSLASGLWIGEVPDVLSRLSFAEKLLVARVRHNSCVVRVASGRLKMAANAILFQNPSVKIYHKLPPSREELSEVLAIVFIGESKPTREDYERTPLLVRRNFVAEALLWLKLNHVDYHDLTISAENLATYPLAGVPVHVDFRKRDGEGNKELLTQSVYDHDIEQGTSSGPCSFAVSGLTGGEYETMSIEALRAKALNHLTEHGDFMEGDLEDVRARVPVTRTAAKKNVVTTIPKAFLPLLSGTAVKAVVMYVTDYITKQGLKTYQIFDAVADVLRRSAMSPQEQLWWRSFVAVGWKHFSVSEESVDGDDILEDTVRIGKVGEAYVSISTTDDYLFHPKELAHLNVYEWTQMCERVSISSESSMESDSHDNDVSAGGCDDFLQDWQTLCDRAKAKTDWSFKEYFVAEGDVDELRPYTGQFKKSKPMSFRFLPGHPLRKTHLVKYHPSRRNWVPDFKGGQLPRSDQGNREYYCAAMLALFKPWYLAENLKRVEQTWDEAFGEYVFTDRQRQVLANFDLRYECLDERDDFRARDVGTPRRLDVDGQDDGCNDQYDLAAGNDVDDDFDGPDELSTYMDMNGTAREHQRKMDEISVTMGSAGWLKSVPAAVEPCSEEILRQSPAKWTKCIKSLRDMVVTSKAQTTPSDITHLSQAENKCQQQGFVAITDSAGLQALSMDRTFRLRKVLESVCEEFSLNPEQSRAFHACHTLIVQGFDAKKISGGRTVKFLRAELRELEALDEASKAVTALGGLPGPVFETRSEVLAWSKSRLVPSSPSVKRRLSNEEGPSIRAASSNKRARTRPVGPLGLEWDEINFSCAYDAVLTILFNAWRCDKGVLDNVEGRNAKKLRHGFERVIDSEDFRRLRDALRTRLHKDEPSKFPYGQACIAVSDVYYALFAPTTTWTETVYHCRACRTGVTTITHSWASTSSVVSRSPKPSIRDWLVAHLNPIPTPCPICQGCTEANVRLRDDVERLGLAAFALTGDNWYCEPRIDLSIGDRAVLLDLKGIVFWNASHFTAIVVDDTKVAWFHDGMTTKATCRKLGEISDWTPLHQLGVVGIPVLAIYSAETVLAWSETFNHRIRTIVKCLLYSTEHAHPLIINVEGRRPDLAKDHIDWLETENWVPSQVIPAVVHDTSEDRWVIRASDDDADVSSDIRFTCLFNRPADKTGVQNVAVMSLLQSGMEWYNNLLVVAHRGNGRPVDVSDDIRDLFSTTFRERMKWTVVDSTFPAEEPPSQCVHTRIAVKVDDVEWPGTSLFSNELLTSIVTETSPTAWLSAISGKGMMRRIVHQVLRKRTIHALTNFFTKDRLPDLFWHLQNVNGFIFGDVPFSVLFGACMNSNRVDIAVARGRAEVIIDFIIRSGYDSQDAGRRPDGCYSVWLFKHASVRTPPLRYPSLPTGFLKKENTVKVHECWENNALSVVMYTHLSSAMTVMTASTIYSFYTPISLAGIVILDRLPSPIAATVPLRASVDGDLLEQECSIYCPAKPRTLSSSVGLDLFTWGGLDLEQTSCACEASAFSAPLRWVLSRSGRCLNANCGFYNSVVDVPFPGGFVQRDFDWLCSKADRLLAHIPLAQLVATADLGLHFIRGAANASGVSEYEDPVGRGWKAVYVGRILPSSKGSKHCARGDCSELPIKDKEMVRDLLMLGRPGPEVPTLDALYLAQVSKLRAMTMAECLHAGLSMSGNWPYTVPSAMGEQLHIRLPPKYIDFPSWTETKSPTDVAIVGTRYNNSLLPDYNGQDFVSSEDGLVQQPIFDEHMRLIRPWDQYDVLRPGTIVLVNAKLYSHTHASFINWSFLMEDMKVLIPADQMSDSYPQDFPSPSLLRNVK
ncbi:hypothetical protein EYR38_010541 [Pleurotus pulmonarius]|nr:hypothetical protein EYR38_010541 [Pleurotus pulmonarius]